MIGDFEDDTHYCLKCHSTILGLDNYVSHRKLGCGKTLNSEEIAKPGLSAQLLPPENDEPFSLKADDFFSSLELQSSSKKPNNASSGGKSNSGVLTRSKASAVIQASSGKDVHYLDPVKHEGEWISEHIKSLDNDTQHKHDTDRTHKKEEHANIEIYGGSDEDSDEYEYEDDDSEYEDDDDNAPPRSFTGGKWKPTSSPIQWMRPSSSNEDRDWNTPPPHHTGAKWKPSKLLDLHSIEHSGGKWKSPKENFEIPPPSFTGSKWTPSKTAVKQESDKGKIKSRFDKYEDLNYKWEFEEPPPEHSKGKWKPEVETPPPSYTKGKWKPMLPKELEQGPPPSYTKGKWKPQGDSEEKPREKWLSKNIAISSKSEQVPPFRKSSGMVQYWCGPCNRRLASKIVYERHLKSELHFKRTLHDREFDDSSYLNFVVNKRIVKPIPSRPKTNDLKNKIGSDTKVRRKIFMTCEGCKSRVNSQLMGKHLISHYHCSKSDLNLPESQNMVIENIHGIILQSPYQCSPCKFYCNTQEWFLQHWLSSAHRAIALSSSSFFWCSVCKFQAETSDLMYEHLVSEEHSEMISVINRSVPVVIKKVTPISCIICGQQFQLNIQLRKHCEKEGHSYSATSCDDYQNKHNCTRCDAVLTSKIALQRHQTFKHNQKFFICSICCLNFESILEAKRHRSTPEHRCAVQQKRQKEGLQRYLEKSCSYCPERFQDIVKLKEHLKEKHPEQNHSCPYCGQVFTIPQELTVHIRKKACTFSKVDSKRNSCDQCQFQTDSTAEFLFHKVLHGEPLMIHPEDQGNSSTKPVAQYKCPICQKFYVKSSLRCHLRIHTKERPFVCPLCNAGFVRKNNWALHMKNHDRKDIKKVEKVIQNTELGERPFLCSTCGASFKKRWILQQHMTRHTGKSIKCPHSGCVFSARFLAELKAHQLIHSDNKPYSCDRCGYCGKTKQHLERHMTMHEDTKKYRCPQCSFSSRLASHLKRHLRLHTGAKPFACPHCDYCCNNLENLRKHVLSTSKHPGKCIYECKFCQGGGGSFETNFAKDFKVHLVTEHPETFVSGREAVTYIAGIYEAVNDGTSVQGFLGQEDKDRNVQKVVLQTDETLSQFQDVIPTTQSNDDRSTILLTSVTTQDSSEHKMQDELFPMLIVSKDVVCIENPSETWNIGGNYDVDESGSLVPFHSEGETLFQEHFQ